MTTHDYSKDYPHSILAFRLSSYYLKLFAAYNANTGLKVRQCQGSVE